MRPTTRNWAIPGLMALALAMSMQERSWCSGGPGGGGGGGGGGGTTNPFVGSWGGDLPSPFNPLLQYDFTFTKDFRFTLVEIDQITGVTTTFTGTYTLGGVGPDGLPLLTLFSRGQILMQEEYSPSGGAFVFRGTIFLVIGKF